MRWTRPRVQAGSAETRTTTSTYRRELGINAGIPDPLAEVWWRVRVPETAADADFEPTKELRATEGTKARPKQQMNAPHQLQRPGAYPFLFIPIPVSRVRARFLSLSAHSCPCPHMQSLSFRPRQLQSTRPAHPHLVRRLPPTRTRSTREFVLAFLLLRASVRPSLRVLLLSSSLLLPPYETSIRPSPSRLPTNAESTSRCRSSPKQRVFASRIHVLASLSGTHALTALYTASHRKDRQPYPTHATDSLVSLVSKCRTCPQGRIRIIQLRGTNFERRRRNDDGPGSRLGWGLV